MATTSYSRELIGKCLDDDGFEKTQPSEATLLEDEEENVTHEGSGVESTEGNDQNDDLHNAPAGDTCGSGPSLDENVEVGDIAEIVGLTSEKGKLANGYYGKVLSSDASKQRFGILLEDGRSFLVRPENLRMGMKEDELSTDDERLLLGLRPAAEDVRALPFQERVQAIYGFGTAKPSSMT